MLSNVLNIYQSSWRITAILLIVSTNLYAENFSKYKLNLGLAAVAIDPDIGSPVAIIEYKDKQSQDFVYIGTEIKPGLFVTKINGKGITIEGGDKKFTLKVGQNVSAEYVNISRISNINNKSGNVIQDANTVARRWMALADIMSGTLKNPKRIIPKGKYAGGAMIEFKPTGVLKNAGIRQNDIITKVNGLDLGDASRNHLFDYFKSNPKITISVIRDNKPISLAFEAL